MIYDIHKTPQDDFIFKKIFGDRNNEDILKDLLESILNTKIDLKVTIKSAELDREKKDNKYGVLDIFAQFTIEEKGITAEEKEEEKKEITADIEMQIEDQHNMGERSLYYGAELYYNSLKKSEKYTKNKKTIGICILSFELFQSEDYIVKGQMMTEDKHEVITDGIQLYYIQLPTFERTKGKIKGRKKLEQWLNFIIHRDKEAVDMAIKENDKVEKAEEILKAILADDELQEELRIREKHRMDYNNDMMYAKQEGRKEDKLEVAKKLLARGLEIFDIQDITGLTKKEIEKLARVSS